MSAKYKSPSFLLPNELNTSTNPLNTDGDPATGTGINSLYSMSFPNGTINPITISGLTTTLKVLNTVTVSFWYYPTNLGGGDYMINTGETTTSGIFAIERFEAAIRVRWRNSANTLQFIKTAPNSGVGSALDAANKWYHICVVLDTTNSTGTDKVQIWINGVRNTTGDNSLTGSGFTSAENDVILNDNSQKTNKIDELAFFNKSLTSTEIAALYDGTGSNIRPSNLIASNLNPIAYYPLGEQAQNSGKLPDATGSEWQFPNGVLQDYVMDFDGATVGDYIDAGDIPLEGVYTISFWINPDVSPSLIYFLLDKGDGSSNISVRVTQRSSNVIRFQIGSTHLESIDTLTNNSWNNVILIANGSSSKIYINNGAAFTGTLPTAPNTTQSLLIGTDEDKQSNYYFNGQMSNVVVWNSDQSTNRANIYNNGSPQTTYTVTPQNWWKLNATSVYTPSAPNYTKALDFTGTQHIKSVGTRSFNNFSISFWFNTATSPSAFEGYVSGQTGTGVDYSAGGFSIHYYNGGLVLQSSNVNFNLPFASNIVLGNWNHVVVDIDNSNASTGGKLYLNGQLALETTNSGAYTYSFNNLWIGSRSTSGGNATNLLSDSEVSNVAVFNSNLTSSQVSTLFNFGTPETIASFSPYNHYKLNNNTTGVQDSGSAGNNAVITGTLNSVNSGVAFVPSWKIPTALTIPSINTTSALDFTSAGNKINLNPKFNFDLTSANTISVWVNLDSYSAFNSILTNNGTGGGSTGTYTQLLILTTGSVNNTVAFYTYKQGYSTPAANSGWRSNDIPASEFLNTWHHVMLVRDDQDVSWYYDGQPWGGGTITNAQTENVDVNSIGQGNASAGVVGEISNLAIWNSDQSANKDNIYNNGQPQSSYTATPLSLIHI